MDRDAELDALAAQLEAAGLLAIITLADSTIEYQLTPTAPGSPGSSR